MSRPLHIVSVNQDPGINPARKKGAAVHLRAMREAFRCLGAEVTEIDEPEPLRLREILPQSADCGPIGLIYERYALGRSEAARFASEQRIPYALEVNAPLAEEQATWRGKAESERDRNEDAITFGVAGFVAAVSSQVAAYAVARGAAPGSVFLCPNGIDTRLFKPSAVQGRSPPLRLPESAFVLGFHGRERPWHGFGLLVDATAELLKRGRRVHLLVIGSGDFSDLPRLPADRYTRVPWVTHDRIPAHIGLFDALPLSYPPDSPCYFSPLKLAEAMACGVVPVVPDLGDLPRIVHHDRNGLVYQAGDTRALVSALESLIDEPLLKSRLAVAAAESALSLSWERPALNILHHFGLARGVNPEAQQ
jgi:starch synthase